MANDSIDLTGDLTDGPLDLMQELSDAFKKENMLAYADLRLEVPGQEPIMGLCKVAMPKNPTPGMNYLSLIFIMDITGTEALQGVNQALAKFTGESLKGRMPRVQEVVSLPPAQASREHYIRQLDILLEAQFRPDAEYILERLFPAIHELTAIQTEGPVWWDTPQVSQVRPRPKAPPAPDKGDKGEKGSFLDKIKTFLQKK